MSQTEILLFMFKNQDALLTRDLIVKGVGLKKATVSFEVAKLIKNGYVEEISHDGKYGCKPRLLKISKSGIKEISKGFV